MMKHQVTLVTGLSAFLLAPTLASGQEEIQALEDALTGTVRSIEILSGLEARVEAEPEIAIPLVVSATEKPQMNDEALDERLSSLRRQVSLLRMELDAIESPMAGDPGTGAGGARTPNYGLADTTANGPSVAVNGPTSASAAKLNQRLGGVFAGQGQAFVNAAQRHGLDPNLLAAIAMHETGNGTSNAVRNYNNPGGLMNPKTNWSTLQRFT